MRTFFPRYKWVVLGVVLILLSTLIALIKIGFIPTNNLPTKNLAPTSKTVDLCKPFPTDKGEISCEEAKTIALKKYPGQVLDIQKTTLPYQPGKLPEIETEQRKAWLINIKPNDLSSLPSTPKGPNSKDFQTIEAIKVAVDRNTKAILFFEPFFKK